MSESRTYTLSGAAAKREHARGMPDEPSPRAEMRSAIRPRGRKGEFTRGSAGQMACASLAGTVETRRPLVCGRWPPALHWTPPPRLLPARCGPVKPNPSAGRTGGHVSCQQRGRTRRTSLRGARIGTPCPIADHRTLHPLRNGVCAEALARERGRGCELLDNRPCALGIPRRAPPAAAAPSTFGSPPLSVPPPRTAVCPRAGQDTARAGTILGSWLEMDPHANHPSHLLVAFGVIGKATMPWR